MRQKKTKESALEVIFTPTPDGLVVEKVVLHPANGEAETDLRRFLDRFRDPQLDLSRSIIVEEPK